MVNLDFIGTDKANDPTHKNSPLANVAVGFRRFCSPKLSVFVNALGTYEDASYAEQLVDGSFCISAVSSQHLSPQLRPSTASAAA